MSSYGLSDADVSAIQNAGGSSATPLSGNLVVPGTVRPTSKHRGFFGSIGHWISHEAGVAERNAVDILRNSPAGFVQLGENLYHHPIGTLEHLPGQFAEGVWQDLQHPLRRPFNTALDALGVFGGAGAVVGRAAELGRLATTGETLVNAGRVADDLEPWSPIRQAVHATLMGGPSEARVILHKTPGGETPFAARGMYFSRNPSIKLAQKGLDALYEKYPDVRWTGRTQAGRANKAVFALRTGEKGLSRVQAETLVRKYGKLPDAQHEAVAMVGRGMMPADQLRFIREEVIPKARGAYKDLAHAWERNTEEAAKYLEPDTIVTPETRMEVPAEDGKVNVIEDKPAETKLVKMPPKFAAHVLEAHPELQQIAQTTSKGTFFAIDHESHDLLRDLANRTAAGEDVRAPATGAAPAPAPITQGLRTSARAASRAMERAGRPAEAVTHEEPATATTVTLHPGDTYVVPKIKETDPAIPQRELDHLRDYTAMAKHVSDMRTHSLEQSGFLEHLSATIRTLAPKNIMEGRGVIPDLKALEREIRNHENLKQPDQAAEKQAQLDYWRDRLRTLEGHPPQNVPRPESLDGLPDMITDPALAQHLFRVPEVRGLGRRMAVDQFIRPWRAGKVPVPSELTHAYTGTILQHAAQNPNGAKVIAMGYTEAGRFLYLTRLRERLLESSQVTPKGIPEDYRLPIVTDYWRGNLGPGFHFAGDMMNEGAKTEDELEAAGRWYEPLRNKLFNPKEAVAWANNWAAEHLHDASPSLRYAQQRAGTEYFKTEKDLENKVIPGIRWIDKRHLGGLDKQNPLWSALEDPKARFGLKMVDLINDAQKASILYLKPSYAVPNMLGNAALALIHQGFLSPVNLGRSVKQLFLGKGLDKETEATIRAVMGGGFSGTLSPVGRSIAKRINEGGRRLSEGYGKFVDDPFRFSAFLHEARADGFVSAADLKRLVSEPRFEDRLQDIAIRANDALINYERLGPSEDAIIRRMVFFYPWIKGSTRYGYQMLINHPVASGIIGQEGEQGTEWIKKELGDLPAWAQGLIPVHGGRQVINPASTALFGSPADILETIANTLQGNPDPSVSSLNFLAPADAFAAALATGHTSTPMNLQWSRLHRAFDEGIGSQPIMTLINQALHGDQSYKYGIYPSNPWSTELQRFFFTGGLTERDFNRLRAHYDAWKAAHVSGYGT